LLVDVAMGLYVILAYLAETRPRGVKSKEFLYVAGNKREEAKKTYHMG
jgi:hypothetical protein